MTRDDERAVDQADGAGRPRMTLRSLAIVAVLALLVLAAACWRVWHRPEVVMGEARFHVPPGWKVEGLRSTPHTVVLQNTWREALRREDADEIDVHESESPFDPVDMAQQWERLEVRRMIPGERLEPTPRDAFLRENFRCSDIKRSDSGRIQLACFDGGGRWAATLDGRRAGVRDLSAILRELTAAPAVR